MTALGDALSGRCPYPFCRSAAHRKALFFFAEAALEAELGLLFRDSNGILSREAAGAEALAAFGKLRYAVGAQISEGIDSDDLCDLCYRVVAGDEVLAGVDVRSEIAGVEERRSGHAHMHLRRSGLAHELYYVRAGRSADDRVVDQHDALALYRGGNGVELYVDGLLALALFRLDKGARDILVFDEADAVGDTGLL